MARPLRIAFSGPFYRVSSRDNERKTVSLVPTCHLFQPQTLVCSAPFCSQRDQLDSTDRRKDRAGIQPWEMDTECGGVQRVVRGSNAA